MENNFLSTLMSHSYLAAFLPSIVAIFRIKNGNLPQRILSILVFTSLFVELFARFGESLFGIKNNLFLLHIFTIIEFALIALIYQGSLKVFKRKNIMYGLIAGFSIYSILNSLFHESIFQFNAYARAIEALIIISISLLYFYSTLKNMTEKHLERSPIFWVSAGSLLYFSSSLFIFIYSNILFGDNRNSITIWGLHAIMSIIHYIFYTIALWVKPQNQHYQVY